MYLEDSNLLEIHIKDSGVGMDEDELVTLRKKVLFNIYYNSCMLQMKMKKFQNNQLE